MIKHSHWRSFAKLALAIQCIAPIAQADAQSFAISQVESGSTSVPVGRSAERLGFDPARLKRADDYMAALVARGELAGGAVLVARHGQIAWFQTYGKKNLATGEPIQADTIYAIHSMTKPIVGVAMMILFEEGKWELNEPITRYIPEFSGLQVVKAVGAEGGLVLEDVKRPPTMREIMSHTAGFGNANADGDAVDKMLRERNVLGASSLKGMIDRMVGVPLSFQPGTSWRYSSAVDIQAYLVEKLSGQRLSVFLEQRIFRPLRMRDTGYFVPAEHAARLAMTYSFNSATRRLEAIPYTNTLLGPPALERGGGGLVSTISDYARFCQMLLDRGDLDGVRILSPATVELLGTNVLPRDVRINSNGTALARFDEATGFGLNFKVSMDPRAAGGLEGKGTISWAGAAGTGFWVDPSNDLIFVGMVQRRGGINGQDIGSLMRTLVYQALSDPKQ